MHSSKSSSVYSRELASAGPMPNLRHLDKVAAPLALRRSSLSPSSSLVVAFRLVQRRRYSAQGVEPELAGVPRPAQRVSPAELVPASTRQPDRTRLAKSDAADYVTQVVSAPLPGGDHLHEMAGQFDDGAVGAVERPQGFYSVKVVNAWRKMLERELQLSPELKAQIFGHNIYADPALRVGDHFEMYEFQSRGFGHAALSKAQLLSIERRIRHLSGAPNKALAAAWARLGPVASNVDRYAQTATTRRFDTLKDVGPFRETLRKANFATQPDVSSSSTGDAVDLEAPAAAVTSSSFSNAGAADDGLASTDGTADSAVEEAASSSDGVVAKQADGAASEAQKAALPDRLILWDDLARACRIFTQHLPKEHSLDSSIFPVTPTVLFYSLLGQNRYHLVKHSRTDGGYDIYVNSFNVRKGLYLLHKRLNEAGIPHRFPLLPAIASSELSRGPQLVKAKSAKEVWNLYHAGEPEKSGRGAVSPLKLDVETVDDPTALVDSTPGSDDDFRMQMHSQTLKREAHARAADQHPSKRVRTVEPSEDATDPPADEPSFDDLPAPDAAFSAPPASAPSSPPSPVPPLSPQHAALKDIVQQAKQGALKSFELEALRLAHEHALAHGGATFIALDVEFWEREHSVLLEFGWTLLEYTEEVDSGEITERREDQHVIIKENKSKRNGRHAPDARDHFDFGRSITLSQNSLYHLLSALLTSHSSAHETFLIFHDPRGDMRSLAQLGFDPPADFRTDLRQLGAPSEKGDAHGNIWVVDTQRLFSAWTGRKAQVGLEKACRELEVPTRRLHNAGNDAHYTLDLFERLMDRRRLPSPSSPLLKELDERAARLAESKKQTQQRTDEKREQKALDRVRAMAVK
ncbi:uncharacterized protein JCM10292_004927 [Rhodotorula paludigena]|uniref:uncharacterized protein n=1 Tax=Rhodotorula paludigena TaxID=86838 RepID=UPI003178467A